MKKIKSSGLFLIKDDRELTNSTACGLGKTHTQTNNSQKSQKGYFLENVNVG